MRVKVEWVAEIDDEMFSALALRLPSGKGKQGIAERLRIAMAADCDMLFNDLLAEGRAERDEQKTEEGSP